MGKSYNSNLISKIMLYPGTGGVKKQHGSGLRFFAGSRSGFNEQVRIRNTAFMAGAELSNFGILSKALEANDEIILSCESEQVGAGVARISKARSQSRPKKDQTSHNVADPSPYGRDLNQFAGYESGQSPVVFTKNSLQKFKKVTGAGRLVYCLFNH